MSPPLRETRSSPGLRPGCQSGLRPSVAAPLWGRSPDQGLLSRAALGPRSSPAPGAPGLLRWIWIWILDSCPAAQEHLFSSVLLAEKFKARFGSLSSPLRDSGLLLLSHLSFRPNSLDLFKPLALCAFWRATPTLPREKEDKYTKGSSSLVITQGVTIHGM